MKRWIQLLLAGAMTLSLAACGGGSEGNSGQETDKDIDLTAVYSSMEAACDWWDEGYMVDIEGEMLEMYYPGLSELAADQLIVRTAMMSAVANEVALVKCQSAEDADKAEEILQSRIDYQVGDDENVGGAFHPEAIESWKEASVLRQGNCVAMVAVDGRQQELEDIFSQAFA